MLHVARALDQRPAQLHGLSHRDIRPQGRIGSFVLVAESTAIVGGDLIVVRRNFSLDAWRRDDGQRSTKVIELTRTPDTFLDVTECDALSLELEPLLQRSGGDYASASVAKHVHAILLAMRALGGTRHVSEVKGWVDAGFPGRWMDVPTEMADLAHPGSRSSRFAPEARILERVRSGEYRLLEARDSSATGE